ncbi:uncharacterized protein PHACADRAFT_105609 [Phanerochaete carnosa HHB-10118-sp]|uniref:Uncharacterized protein n=1 Tax=Phanerochaete carnosa (strain HHB-10118-sp) TaxID=650164 RepID=K5UL39_PHACS|nr:uncharacterized protein PHACADRAFT_105609 [Phanerochaete carnosa HHB-10118-sp]EKM50341.1 hypothetical protein PHACADRAFT_105609 [Phanerochaete carnosa HHB-10118-sp]
MHNPVLSVSMQGTVFWKPVFEYDNSENDGTITFRKTLFHTTTFMAKVFDREVNEAVYRHSQRQRNNSVSFDFEHKAFEVLAVVALQDNRTMTEFDAALQHVKERTVEVVHATTQQSDTIGPRSKLNLYQKVFNFAGLNYECDTFKTSSAPLYQTKVVDVTVRVRPVSFIRDIEVIYGDYAAQAPAVRVVEVSGGNDDINAGFGGKYVWLRPIYTYNPAEAASRFDLIIQDGEHLDWPDLAKWAGGKYRFLRAVNDHMSPVKITQLALLRGGYVEKVDGWGYSEKTGDINGGRWGDYLYLVWKTHAVPDHIS